MSLGSAWDDITKELWKLTPQSNSLNTKTWLRVQKYNIISSLITNFIIHTKFNNLVNEYRTQDTDYLNIHNMRDKGYKTYMMDDDAVNKLNENLQVISSGAVNMDTSAAYIELRRYICNITWDMQRIFNILEQIDDIEEKIDIHVVEIQSWNADYDKDWMTETNDGIKKMTQLETKRREQNTNKILMSSWRNK